MCALTEPIKNSSPLPERFVFTELIPEAKLPTLLSQLSQEVDRLDVNLMKLSDSIEKFTLLDISKSDAQQDPDQEKGLIGSLASLIYRFSVHNNRFEALNTHLSTIV